jgi:nucleotide-binding universal stress UspA family protein
VAVGFHDVDGADPRRFNVRAAAMTISPESVMSAELLVPLDGSTLADEAVAHAAEIARRIGGSLHLVRVHTPLNMFVVPTDAAVSIPDPIVDERIRADAEEWLSRRARAVSALNDVPVSRELRVGMPEAEIVLASSERRSRLVVLTTRGAGGAASSWLGSVADSVIRHAKCPVLAMSPEAVKCDVHLHQVLVLLDGSEASSAIIPHAVWLAEAFAAKIDYLRLMPPPENPAVAIRDHISRTKPDVVALATHGRGFTRLFLGGVADELVRTGNRPTLVFRPHDISWTKDENAAPATSRHES